VRTNNQCAMCGVCHVIHVLQLPMVSKMHCKKIVFNLID
jgi:hypothetical protein